MDDQKNKSVDLQKKKNLHKHIFVFTCILFEINDDDKCHDKICLNISVIQINSRTLQTNNI